MSDDFIEELRRRARISEVVGSRIEFDRAKSNPRRGDYWACCPFHGEKTPSFHVLDDKGVYHCFGCGEHGDAFKFVMEFEKLGFMDAAKRLAGEFGVPVPERSPEAAARAKKRRTLYDVMNLAQDFYRKQLGSDGGAGAREYLRGRELSADMWDRFGIGLALNSSDALLKHLQSEKVELDLIKECGLLGRDEPGATPRDFFRNRIMIPVRDGEGRIIAFGGRALSPNARAKYINSPATTLFDKSRVLYNLDQARKPVREAGGVIAAEGYMDVIAFARAGFANAVAPMGTAVTQEHLTELWRLAPEPIICFDGDDAGRRAAFRVLDMALPLIESGHSLKFVLLPEGQDPDDMVRSGGRPAIEAALGQAESLAGMIWRAALSSNSLETPEGRVSFEAEIDRLTGLIQEQRSRFHFRKALRDRFRQEISTPSRGTGGFRVSPRGGFGRGHVVGASEALKRSALAQSGGKKTSLHPMRQPQMALGGRHREGLLVFTLVNHPGVLEAHVEDFAACEIRDPELLTLKTALLEAVTTHPGLDTEALRGHFMNRGIGEIAERLAAQDVLKCVGFAQESATQNDAEKHWLEVLASHNMASALLQDLQDAERAFVSERTEDNLDRLRAVQHQLLKHERGETVGERSAS